MKGRIGSILVLRGSGARIRFPAAMILATISVAGAIAPDMARVPAFTRASTAPSVAAAGTGSGTESAGSPPMTKTAAGRAELLDLARYELVDLTHPFDARTIFWPTAPSGFELKRLSYGKTDKGYFYAANSFSMPEHGGTHLDAPIHFSESGVTVDRVPLRKLVGPAFVIDITEKAAKDPDYRATPDDVADFERRQGPIPAEGIVLLRTGWSKRWPDRKAYLGDDTPGDASHLHFPSFGLDAARLLVEGRKVAAIGVDVASIDYGPSSDFPVHQLVGRHDVPGFENLTDLEKLPPRGALLVALPMKIEGGSGGPLRAIALVPRTAVK